MTSSGGHLTASSGGHLTASSGGQLTGMNRSTLLCPSPGGIYYVYYCRTYIKAVRGEEALRGVRLHRRDRDRSRRDSFTKFVQSF